LKWIHTSLLVGETWLWWWRN